MVSIWEDKEIRFDMPFSHMRLRNGEKVYDRIESIEDTKGNSGTKGRMIITNLRIIWHAFKSPRINLSIGFNCVMSNSSRTVNSGLRGTTEALHILGCFSGSRYEFIFTNLVPGNTRHFTSAMGVHRAYIASRMYRELKLRGAIIQNKQLIMLPHEKITISEHGVWNLSSDTGNLGTLVATNIRVVWFADINATFNISLPFIEIESIKVRASKFGEALVIMSLGSSGGYMLGFRVDPPDKLLALHKELSTLHSVYTKTPNFGVTYTWQNDQLPKHPEVDNFADIEEIGEPRGETGAAIYLASEAARTETKTDEKPPVFNSYLGLAIEPLREGFTLKSLWEVLPSN